MVDSIVTRLCWLGFGSCKLVSIFLLWTLLGSIIQAAGHARSSESDLSLGQPTLPTTKADDFSSPLESKIEKILSQVEVITRIQERLSKQIGDVCQPVGNQDTVKKSTSSGGHIEPVVEKDVYKFNRLASNLIPSLSLSGQHYGRRWGASPLIQQNASGARAGAMAEDNHSGPTPSDWTTVKEQLSGLRLALNKLMSRVLEQSYQYEQIWSQLALIKDECSLAYQSILPNGLTTQVSDNGLRSAATSAADRKDQGTLQIEQQYKQEQRCQMGGLRSSDISTLVRLLSQELSNVCPACPATHQLHEASKPKEDAWLGRQLAEISSVTKQSAQILNRLSTWADQGPTRTLVLEPTEEAVMGQNMSVSVATNASKHTGSQVSVRTSSRWQPGSKVPQNCRSSTSLDVPRGCQELRAAGATCSGKYLVYVMDEWRQLYCDMTERDPWTVVMRRIDKTRWQDHSGLVQMDTSGGTEANGASKSNSLQLLAKLRAQQESFDVDWINYEQGFGATDDWAEFFGGLSLIHKLTSGGGELQVEIEWSQGRRQRLECSHFVVADASLQYRVSIANCSSREEAKALIEALLSMDGAPFQVGGLRDCKWGWWRAGNNAIGQHLSEPTGPLPLLWPSDSQESLHRLQLKVRSHQ